MSGWFCNQRFQQTSRSGKQWSTEDDSPAHTVKTSMFQREIVKVKDRKRTLEHLKDTNSGTS